ncbi:MAG: germination protein YpeB [Clostridia bacterium]|nr:germination protein YpeB [Clostridia bacterium]
MTFALLFVLSLSANAAQAAEARALRLHVEMEQQRNMAEVVGAMADIEVNLQKLLLASGARQSAELLGETALLAQHLEGGLARLPAEDSGTGDAMKFAGQMGDYIMTLASQVSGGGMLSTRDEKQLEGLLAACQGLNAHLVSAAQESGGAALPDEENESAIPYPSLIYDGPFSDGRTEQTPRALTGGRITREQARMAAARYAGADEEKIREAADSGGIFEAFGFSADTPDGRVSVQVTGQGGHLLWMMPESAEFEERVSQEACLAYAQAWLEEMGFGRMERCFVQQYDGMVVANFAAVQEGVLLYPDQVKLQMSMATGRVVGAECSQYLMNHERRNGLVPAMTQEQAREMLTSRLQADEGRLCVIPTDAGERLCWEFRGTFSGETYYVYIDASTGEATEILRISRTAQGEAAV